MDYSEGEELWHFQWDEIQDPSRVWMKWNKDEEEGENIGYKNIYDYAFMFFHCCLLKTVKILLKI